MIRSAQKADAFAIASLHKRSLKDSFLAKLGSGFLESLYVFLIKKEFVIVYAEENVIKGFVSFSINSSGMMKRFLITCPVCILKLIGIILSSPEFLKQFIETLSAPYKSKTLQSSAGKVKLPNAEFLSFAVDPNYQKSGIGIQLLKAMENQFVQNGIRKYKLFAGVSMESANKFYNKNGFVLVAQVTIHGNELSNIFTKEL